MTDEYLVRKNFEEVKKSESNIFLFGSVGAGKTTLINKLCGIDLLTKAGGFSCTRDVQYARDPFGNIIIDFPGLNAAEEIVKHLKIQKSCLSSIPARMICLVIKFSVRYDDIIKSALQMVKIFYENKENILVIITNTENITMVQIAEIEAALSKKCKIDSKHIIFTSSLMSAEVLRKRLNDAKSNMKNIEKVQIKDRNLLNTVGTDGDIDVIEEREQFLKEYKENLQKFKNEFNKASCNSLKFALYHSFVAYKDDLVERFSEIVKKKVTDTDTAIVEIITFNNEIFVEFDCFTKIVLPSLKVEVANFDSNNSSNTRYKKCPYCGTIWFKVKGCDSMPCGRRTKLRDIFFGRFKNYIVRFAKGIFNIKTVDEKSNSDIGQDTEFVGLTPEEKEMNKTRGTDKSIIVAQGCGKTLNWSQMEDVTDMVNKQIRENFRETHDTKILKKMENIKIDIFNENE